MKRLCVAAHLRFATNFRLYARIRQFRSCVPGCLRFVSVALLAAILSLSRSPQISDPAPALALDALTCESYFTFPLPWQTIAGVLHVGGSGGYIQGAHIIPGAGSPYYEASASLTSDVRNLYRITVSVYFNNPGNLADTADLSIQVNLKGIGPIAQINRAIPSDSNWHTLTFFFAPPGVTRDTTIVILRNADPDVAIQINEQCFLNLPTPSPTPSPTLAITNTPFPTDTPAPTSTAIPSSTPLPTETPAPTASDTAIPSDTPTGTLAPTSRPTLTPGPSHTAIPSTISSGDIQTPVPPSACTDPFNPCGALPFPVPNFTPLALNSPVPITAAAFQGSVTPFGTPTPFGPGTGTMTTTADAGGIYEFGTNVAGAAENLITTPVLYDAGGFAVSVGDGANQLGQQVGLFFSVVRVAQNFFLGRTGNIIAALLLMVIVIVLVRLIVFAIPIVRRIADFVFTIIKAIPFA